MVSRASVELAPVDVESAIEDHGRAIVIGADRPAVSLLADSVSAMGFAVERAETIEEAAGAQAELANLIVADLPHEQSVDPAVLGELRAMSDAALITVVEPDERAVARCLDKGADDCITRPIHKAELEARIRRRLQPCEPLPGRYDFGWITVDEVARHIAVHGAVVGTTAREFELISFLSRFPRTVFSRAELLEKVWRSSTDWQSPTTVTEHVYRLRRKLEAVSGRTPLVTVPGAGYRFDP